MPKYIVRIEECFTHAITVEAPDEDQATEQAIETYTQDGLRQFSEDEFDWVHQSTYLIPETPES